uniref:Uncharacterized protein n=1 Tax=Steinernema glaseri TaxID=37863 RepID=A0A1I7YQL1_9BILA
MSAKTCEENEHCVVLEPNHFVSFEMCQPSPSKWLARSKILEFQRARRKRAIFPCLQQAVVTPGRGPPIVFAISAELAALGLEVLVRMRKLASRFPRGNTLFIAFAHILRMLRTSARPWRPKNFITPRCRYFSEFNI